MFQLHDRRPDRPTDKVSHIETRERKEKNRDYLRKENLTNTQTCHLFGISLPFEMANVTALF